METSSSVAMATSTEMEYSVPNLPSSVLGKLNEFRTQSLFTDIELCVENQTFRCHRAVLAGSSSLLHSSFILNGDKVKLEDFFKLVNAAIIPDLLEFMYTGRIIIKDSNLQDLQWAAQLLQLDDLGKGCAIFRSQYLDCENEVEKPTDNPTVNTSVATFLPQISPNNSHPRPDHVNHSDGQKHHREKTMLASQMTANCRQTISRDIVSTDSLHWHGDDNNDENTSCHNNNTSTDNHSKCISDQNNIASNQSNSDYDNTIHSSSTSNHSDRYSIHGNSADVQDKRDNIHSDTSRDHGSNITDNSNNVINHISISSHSDEIFHHGNNIGSCSNIVSEHDNSGSFHDNNLNDRSNSVGRKNDHNSIARDRSHNNNSVSSLNGSVGSHSDQLLCHSNHVGRHGDPAGSHGNPVGSHSNLVSNRGDGVVNVKVEEPCEVIMTKYLQSSSTYVSDDCSGNNYIKAMDEAENKKREDTGSMTSNESIIVVTEESNPQTFVQNLIHNQTYFNKSSVRSQEEKYSQLGDQVHLVNNETMRIQTQFVEGDNFTPDLGLELSSTSMDPNGSTPGNERDKTGQFQTGITDTESLSSQIYYGVQECMICSKTFSSKQKYEAHMRAHKNIGFFKCTVCGETFKWRTQLYRHRNRKHHELVHHVCRECGQRFSGLAAFEQHRASHNQEKRYHCKECDNWFGRQELYKRHMKQHRTMRPVCHFCGKSFTRKDYYKEHLNVQHLGGKPHKCDVCGKVFKWRSLLTYHKNREHLGIKDYTCIECGSVFANMTLLKQHHATHDNNATYRCKECGKTFGRKTVYQVHVNRHKTKPPCNFLRSTTSATSDPVTNTL